MKLLLILPLALLAGCSSRPVIRGFELSVTDDNRRYELVNRTGNDLHNVRIVGELYTPFRVYTLEPWKAELWSTDFPLHSGMVYNEGINRLVLWGKCDEGKFSTEWPIGEGVQSPPASKKPVSGQEMPRGEKMTVP